MNLWDLETYKRCERWHSFDGSRCEIATFADLGECVVTGIKGSIVKYKIDGCNKVYSKKVTSSMYNFSSICVSADQT